MKKTAVILVLLVGWLGAKAQNNLTLYHMESIPQVLSVNPALDPDCKWYFGTPAMSAFDFTFKSGQLSARKINNIFSPEAGSDSFRINLNNLSDLVGRNAFVNMDANVELLTFGFRLHKSFFHASLTEKVKTRVDIPGDIFKFAFQGNGGDNLGYEFNFGPGFDILHTRELAVGYQRTSLGDRLKLGGRLKYVYGVNTINTERNNLTFTTRPQDFAYTLKSDIKVNAASSFIDIDQAIGSDSTSGGSIVPEPSKIAFGANNWGWGIDLGASFEITDRITVSASVVDLGRIYWNENTINAQSRNPNASFEFIGIDAKEFLGDSAAGAEAIVDTLLDRFALDTTREGFTTGLMGGMYVGGTFKVFEKHKAGILLNGSFYNKRFYPGVTISWNSRFGRILGLSASYTATRGNFSNFGFGSSLNLGPEQFYFVSDNLIGTALGNTRNIGFRFGWNHTFGRKKTQKKKKDGKL
jgi:hypothetical protein